MDFPSRILIRGVEVAGRGARVRLDVGDDSPIELAAAVCPPFSAGAEIDGAALRALVDASADWDVRETALRLLSYRPRSNRELSERLERKGFDPERIERCLAALRDGGWVDDAAFAAAHARDAVRLRPRGSRRLVSELRRRGVAESVAVEAVERVLVEEESPDTDLALRAAQGWFRRAPATDRERLCGVGDRSDVERVRRRFWGFMARRGFGPDAVRLAIDGLCE